MCDLAVWNLPVNPHGTSAATSEYRAALYMVLHIRRSATGDERIRVRPGQFPACDRDIPAMRIANKSHIGMKRICSSCVIWCRANPIVAFGTANDRKTGDESCIVATLHGRLRSKSGFKKRHRL